MMTICRFASLLLSLALVAPGLATAEEGAEAIADKGVQLYEHGEYVEAAALFSKAHGLKAEPKYLYNLGLCNLKLGRMATDKAAALRYLETARTNFKACRRDAGAAANEALISKSTRKIDEVDAELEKRRRQPDPTAAKPDAGPAASPDTGATPLVIVTPPRPAAPTKSEPAPFYKKWWFWTLVGAAVVGGGIAVGVAAGSVDDRVPGGQSVNWSTFKQGVR